MDETKIIYHIDDEEFPYLVKLPIAPEKVTLLDFKNVLNRPNYKYFFKSMDDDFGIVKEEIIEDDAHLPCFDGRVVSWLVSAEGSNSSDRTSQCTESHVDGKTLDRHENHLKKHSGHPNDLTCTETESVVSSRPGGHHSHHHHGHGKYDKYHKHNGSRINGHGKSSSGARGGFPYDTPSSMMSSDLETTSFLESEDEEDDDDDASSRITTTTGRATNVSTNTVESVSGGGRGRRRAQRRRRHRQPMSRTSSYSSITDSTMSLNIITVTLNMDTVNFLGISIVGQSNKGGDGGIYVGSIMKGGAVALDGRIEPGDMILQVNDINFEDMTNDEAVRVLREVVQKPAPIKLVVAKCWDPNPKGYFTIPRTEPVRPIDPGAWVAHTAALRGETYPLRPPSVSTLSSNSSSIASSLPDIDRPLEELQLSVNSDMLTIVRAMARPDSGLEIRDRMWLKLTIPNAFIGADVVDWLESRVDGLQDKRDARKYASQMLKAGYIKHTVNKQSFSEQCYYIFGDLLSTDVSYSELSELRLDECESAGVGTVNVIGGVNSGAWTPMVPYASTYLPPPTLPPPSTHCYTNDPSLYAYTREEESLHSGSGGSGGSDKGRANAKNGGAIGLHPKGGSSGGSSTTGGCIGMPPVPAVGGQQQRSQSRAGSSGGSSSATATPSMQDDRQSFRMAMGNPCFLDVDAL